MPLVVYLSPAEFTQLRAVRAHLGWNVITLPPGLARLLASPEPTGSTAVKATIGMVWVALCAANAAGVLIAKITSYIFPVTDQFIS